MWIQYEDIETINCRRNVNQCEARFCLVAQNTIEYRKDVKRYVFLEEFMTKIMPVALYLKLYDKNIIFSFSRNFFTYPNVIVRTSHDNNSI